MVREPRSDDHIRGDVVESLIADHPDLPQDLRLTASFTYVRMHSGRHGLSYTQPELEVWAERTTGFARRSVDVYVYFNNDPEGWAVINARRLPHLVGGERGPVEPQVP